MNLHPLYYIGVQLGQAAIVLFVTYMVVVHYMAWARIRAVNKGHVPAEQISEMVHKVTEENAWLDILNRLGNHAIAGSVAFMLVGWGYPLLKLI